MYTASTVHTAMVECHMYVVCIACAYCMCVCVYVYAYVYDPLYALCADVGVRVCMCMCMSYLLTHATYLHADRLTQLASHPHS